MNTHPPLQFDSALIAPRYGARFPRSIQLNELAQGERTQVFQKIQTGKYKTIDRPCRICDGVKFEVLAEHDRYALPIQTTICKGCGLVQTNPAFRQEDYIDFYQQHYRQLYLADLVGEPKDLYQEEVWRGQKILRFLKKRIELPSKSLVLEVGCGAGGILHAFRDRRFRVMGTDYGVENMNYGRSTGIDIREGDIFSLSLTERPHLIIYSHVLEHVLDLNSELQKIRELLAPGGYLYIEVPGIRAVRVNASHVDFMQSFHLAHIYNFTLNTLTTLLRKNGFELLSGDEHIRSVFKISAATRSTACDYSETKKYMQNTERFQEIYRYVFRFRVLGRSVVDKLQSAGIFVLKKAGLYSWARRVLT